MARRNKNQWRVRRRRAVKEAEDAVTEIAESLPVNLRDIAMRRRVCRIEFRQLLTQGALAAHKDGFTIYVQCDAGQEADLTERFIDDGTGGTLPHGIVHRARFTIAHEIAHTFFYDVTTAPPVPKLEIRDGASAARLELACNEVAGSLVLPEFLIAKTIGKLEVIHPEDLRELSAAACVSPQALIRRFNQLVNHPCAIFAAVSYGKKGWIIEAMSRHYSLRNIMPGARPGRNITELVDDFDFALFGGDRPDATVEYVGHGGQRRTIKFECELGSPLAKRRTIFVVGQST